MKFAIDTGALLSLACSHYFEQLLKEHTFIISPLVIEELKQFGRYDDFLGKKAQSIVLKKFTIKTQYTLVSLPIEETERTVFSIAVNEKCLAIIDDSHAARVASEKLSIISKPSFYLLMLLYKQKKIKKAELIEDVTKILTNRNWLGGALGNYAITVLEQL